MTRMATTTWLHPLAAGLMLGATPALADPARLAGREWRVIEIAGARPPPAARFSIGFLPDGRVAGRSGCNRFSGKAEFDQGRLAIGPLAGTRMACPPPLMTVEAQFLGVLQAVDRWSIQRGRLVLTARDGRTLEARRAPRQR
jgi:heat shock protein HslJ